jgi:hypothetical protein
MAEWIDDLDGVPPWERWFRMADAARAEGDDPNDSWPAEAALDGLKLYQETRAGYDGTYTQAIPRSVAQEATELARKRHVAGMPPTAMAERA